MLFLYVKGADVAHVCMQKICFAIKIEFLELAVATYEIPDFFQVSGTKHILFSHSLIYHNGREYKCADLVCKYALKFFLMIFCIIIVYNLFISQL